MSNSDLPKPSLNCRTRSPSKGDGGLTNSASPTGQFSPRQVARWQSLTASSDPSDVDLIESVAAGDKSAMKVLYARHNVEIYRFALRLLGDNALAEDVTSGTFLDAWRQAGAFEGRSEVSIWLLGIAHDRSIATLRRQSSPQDVEACASIKGTRVDPKIGLRRKQQGSILFDCLTNLSAAHREIIDLVYYHQNTIDEVAEIIRVPRNIVITQMFDARQKLAALLRRRLRARPHLLLLNGGVRARDKSDAVTS